MIEEMAVNEPLREWITRFAEEKIEDNKRWDIREDIRKLGRRDFQRAPQKPNCGLTVQRGVERVLGEGSGAAALSRTRCRGLDGKR